MSVECYGLCGLCGAVGCHVVDLVPPPSVR
jgi:hypothetical protein